MVTCQHCNKEFNSEEALRQHTNSKHYETIEQPKISAKSKKKIKNWSIFIVILLIVGLGIFGLMKAAANSRSLPPTDMAGHVEAVPPSHILKKPMDILIHKHMLEHIDGRDGARGGVIINYDCNNYECAPDLIQNLEQFAHDFDYVYVAPFRNMENMVAVTKLGAIRTFDFYDEEAIRGFVAS